MRQPDQYHAFDGEEITLRNIFWTRHLEKAWAAVWLPSNAPWRSEVRYAETAEKAHDAIIQVIEASRAN